MHVDLTLEEMRHILETVSAGDTSKPVVSSIVTKMNFACRNFVPPQTPEEAAEKWKAPI